MQDSRLNPHTPMDTTLGQQTRMTEVIDDVGRRLRGVCAHLSDADFQELIQQIAAIAVKYEALADADRRRTIEPST